MITILNLPDELIENILSYTSYDEVSRLRLVCKRFDIAAQHVLNHGFYKVEKFHSLCLRSVKAQLPRRESERRKHPLARHCDILTAVETRLSLLAMTFMKFVETNYCCFIPGKVLDEIFKVVRYVSKEQAPARAHEILQELRDISSMAMEYFDENIAPAFKKAKEKGPKLSVTVFGEFSANGFWRGISWAPNCRGPRTPATNFQTFMAQGMDVMPGQQSFQKHSPERSSSHNDGSSYVFKLSNRIRCLQKKNAILKREFIEHQQKLIEQKRITSELERKVTAQATKIDEQDVKLEEINRKCNDNERVLSTMAEILQLRGSTEDVVTKDKHDKPIQPESEAPSSRKRKCFDPHKMETRQKRARKEETNTCSS